MKQFDAIVRFMLYFHSFHSLCHMVIMYSHKFSLTQRHESAQLNKLVESHAEQRYCSFGQKSKCLWKSSGAFILGARPARRPTAQIFSRREHFLRLDIMHEPALKGTYKFFFSFKHCCHIWNKLLLRVLTKSDI